MGKELDNFLKKPKYSCKVCSHPKANLFNKHLIEFAKRSKELDCFVSWERYIKLYARPKYDYPFGWRATKRHVEECLGIK